MEEGFYRDYVGHHPTAGLASSEYGLKSVGSLSTGMDNEGEMRSSPN